MIKLNVKFDIQAARRDLALDEKEVNKGAARALQRVAITGRKAADQAIRARAAIKSSAVKNALEVRIPYGSRALIRDIQASGSPIPLRDWNARQGSRKGVTFSVVKGQRKQYMREGRKAFIVNRLGNHVFVRVTADPPGPQRPKISKRYGPSLTQRFRTKNVQDAIDRAARARWPIEFNREMQYRKGKAG